MVKDDDSVKPRVEVKATNKVVIALRLARAGWFDGDPEKVMRGRVDLVMAAWEYEGFCGVFDRTWQKLNDPKR